MLNHDKKDFCKVCLLAIDTKETLDGLKMDVDMLVRKVNEMEEVIGHSKIVDGLQGEIGLVARRVKGVEEDGLNFSGFGASDGDKEAVTKLDKLNKCREAERSRRGPNKEEIDLEKLSKDAEKWISEGIAEIRGNAGGDDKETTGTVKIGVATQNRFLVLDKENRRGEEEKKYEILGNSEVRDMRERTKKGVKRGIYSTYGAGIINILEHTKNKQLEGKTTVIHGGGDDIEKLGTELMLKTYKDAIKETRDQGKMCIVSSILPRKGESSYWSSRAIGINNRLHRYCKEMEGVMFVDNWDRFYGNRKLYAADGRHLSRLGTDLLSVIIEEKVEINSNLDKRRKRENIT